MTFLDKDFHDKWLTEKFPKIEDKFYGNKPGEYVVTDSGTKSGIFPILDATYKETGKHVFRCIVKLTKDERDATYTFTDEDKDIALPAGVSAQVVIVHVDKNLEFIDKGHYPMTATRVS